MMIGKLSAERAHNFINGRRCVGRGCEFQTIYPATGAVTATLNEASQHDVDEAVSSAESSQKTWARASVEHRADVLLRTAALLRENEEELAQIETLDTGRSISETSEVDIASAAEVFEFMAHAAVANFGRFRSLGSAIFYTQREPYGICAGIGAWNYPIQIASWKSAAALACGNAMIFKPSELTPLSAVRLAELLCEAGLPDGVFNVIQGDGVVGANLVSRSEISKISVTGSVPTGRAILKLAAANLTPVTLELGGKSPIVVFDDADLDQAVTAVMLGNFYSQGQICSNGTRVFVQSAIYESFVERLVSRTEQLRIGDPLDPNTEFGPMISDKQSRIVLDYIESGVAEGAELVLGGKLRELPGFERARFVEPTIFTNVSDTMKIAREEIFGPVMSVFEFETENEAVRRANDTEFGLAAGVFTKDVARAHRMAGRLEAGVCWINDYNITPVSMPFGGTKSSGFGSENGVEGLLNYSKIKSVYIDTSGT
ncbi:MAG: betaine-aldehyde dehydrogenase [Pseudomonadota bacterium]